MVQRHQNQRFGPDAVIRGYPVMYRRALFPLLSLPCFSLEKSGLCEGLEHARVRGGSSAGASLCNVSVRIMVVSMPAPVWIRAQVVGEPGPSAARGRSLALSGGGLDRHQRTIRILLGLVVIWTPIHWTKGNHG